MLELYKVAHRNDPYFTLKNLLLELRSTYRFDIVMAIQFTHDNANPYVRISSKLKQRANHIDYNYMLNISNYEQSLLRLMCEKRSTVYYSIEPDETVGAESPDGTQWQVLTPEAKMEIYYPLYDEEGIDIIGCLYLCSLYDTKYNKDRFVSDYRLNMINTLVYKLYNESKTSQHVITLLRLFDDFLLKNNPHMLRHHYNVAYWSLKVADELGMKPEDKEALYFACLLHDIGDIYISGEILNKKGKLTDLEYQIEKNHVIYGANLVKEILKPEPKREEIAKYILQHHERYDGKGYPYGLKGKNIELASRIIMVADAVDAMLSKRSYKSAKTLAETIQELKLNKGTQFDPGVVDVMIRVLYERSAAKLNIRNVPILISTLKVITPSGSRLIQGTLIPKDNNYEFHPNYVSELDMLDWGEMMTITLYYVASQDIIEYDATLQRVENGIIYLSRLESSYSSLSYSLYWELEGLLYINESTFIQIKGTRISSEALSFVASEDVADLIHVEEHYVIELYFENNESEKIPGKVTQHFKAGVDDLFYFTYENIPDSTRERIIRQIIRKQAQLRLHFLFDASGDEE